MRWKSSEYKWKYISEEVEIEIYRSGEGYTRNIRLHYTYRQITNIFMFNFINFMFCLEEECYLLLLRVITLIFVTGTRMF